MRDEVVNNISEMVEAGERALGFCEATFTIGELQAHGLADEAGHVHPDCITPAMKPALLQAAHDLKKLVYLGNISLVDPPRQEVPMAIEDCRAAGIRVVIAAGDHPKTVRAIAEEVGIIATKGEAWARFVVDEEKRQGHYYKKVEPRRRCTGSSDWVSVGGGALPVPPRPSLFQHAVPPYLALSSTRWW